VGRGSVCPLFYKKKHSDNERLSRLEATMNRRFATLPGLEGADEDLLQRTLQNFFGFSSFRESQKEVCLHVMQQGSQTVCLFPTGAGKSLCFQLPAVALGGVSLIVSPLIALMQDQVAALQKLCASVKILMFFFLFVHKILQ
jgi:superfamily II DNA helicase RecQ